MPLLFCIPTTVHRGRRLLEELRSIKLAAKMRELGISLSFSRPGVSNENAYAESLFKTMKYHQSYPIRRFRNLDSVRC
jgi:transposase InsO family protein